ncbi:MAG: hypothetical protein HY998_02585 [candidate division NC10 bacterium]|nr:hypothetical protein [candidate division NC10 bacterium]
MQKNTNPFLFFLFLLAFIFPLSGVFTLVGAAQEGMTRSHSGGGVRIEVTWLDSSALAKGEAISFEVRMNTHTVDLDEYDLLKLAFLRNDKGKVFKPKAWESPQDGGHHRSGVLVFPKGDPGSRSLELIIMDVAGIKERAFRWEVK